MITDGELLRAYDEQMRSGSGVLAPGVKEERDGPLRRVVGQFRGFVEGPADLGVDGAALDALIARQRDYFAARGEAVEWKTRAHDRPAGLTTRLRAAGFVSEDEETVLVGVAEDLAGTPVLPDGIQVRIVTDDEDMRRIAAMESEVWGQDWSWLAEDLIGRAAAEPPNITVFVAETTEAVAGTPEAVARTPEAVVVCAAWLVSYRGTEFAGLWGGSTLAPWRGRGIYRALVAARARLAVSRGIRFLQVDASPDSAPILRRLGLRAITTTSPYTWTPPSPHPP